MTQNYFRALVIIILGLAGCYEVRQVQELGAMKVVRVADGDSVEVVPAAGGGRKVKVRLYGIDAPELSQAFGGAAKDATIALLLHQVVLMTKHDIDQYGRIVATIELPNGGSANLELVKRGCAWWYARHAQKEYTLKDAQQSARDAGRGLWADKSPEPPWLWRERNGRRQSYGKK